MNRDPIYQSVMAKMADWYPDTNPGQRCLYFMHAGLAVLTEHGIVSVPHCGTARFQIGYLPALTHLEYRWDGEANDERRIASNYKAGDHLPEMHCWIWLPGHGVVIDFSAGELPIAAEKLGLDWTYKLPPPYHWGRPNELAPDALYIPNRDATYLACKILAGGQ